MPLPFTRQAFLGVFRTYNMLVWPTQIGLFVLAIAVLVLVVQRRPASTRAALVVLAGLWAWMGVVYQWLFFAPLYPVAWVFGGAFIGQAMLFTLAAARPAEDEDEVAPRWSVGLGLGLIIYALAIYPMIGEISDHAYPFNPTFGLPGPTTIFTFGALLIAGGPPRTWLLIIPGLWALVGSLVPFAFGIWEDLGLFVAAAVGVVGLLVRARTTRLHHRQHQQQTDTDHHDHPGHTAAPAPA